jgi:hypothetical protein
MQCTAAGVVVLITVVMEPGRTVGSPLVVVGVQRKVYDGRTHVVRHHRPEEN